MAVKLIEQRKPSWSVFTKRFDENGETGVSATEAIQRAGMSDHVKKTPLITVIDGDYTLIENRYAVVAPDTGKFFGVAGNDYDFMLPSELATTLDDTLTKQFPVIAAGETPDGGGALFILDMGMRPVAKEDVRQYLLIAESYTPGVSLKQAFTPMRFTCMNTLMTALSRATALMTAHHDRNFKATVSGGLHYVLAAQVEAQKTMALFDLMAKRQISPDDLSALLATAYPHRDPETLVALEAALGDATDQFSNSKLTKRRQADQYWNGRADQLRALAQDAFETFDTVNPKVRGSIWAAYNAVVEVQDFAQFDAQSRTLDATASIIGERVAPKTKALNYAAALLTA